MPNNRADHGKFASEYNKARKHILLTQDVCAICGKPVDKTLKQKNSKGEHNPYAPTIDHIIPVSKGGHPHDLANLQLTHWICNRQKSDKLGFQKKDLVHAAPKTTSNRILPLTFDYAGSEALP